MICRCPTACQEYLSRNSKATVAHTYYLCVWLARTIIPGLCTQINSCEPGLAEPTLVDKGVPAITLEVGPAKVRRDRTLIKRAEDFIYHLLEILSMASSSSDRLIGVDVYFLQLS